LVIVFSALAVSSGIAQDKITIEWQDGLLQLRTDAVDLGQVLQALADQGGFKLWLSDNLPTQQVSVQLEMQSLEQILRRLLVDNSYALVYDDKAGVSALYVLPPGKQQLSRLSLTPEIDNEQQQVQQQIVQDALGSSLLPDNIKAAILDQFGTQNTELQQSVMAQRPRAIQELIDALEQMGSPSEATMQQLYERLALEKAKSNNNGPQ
jgi:hypothetical protein